MDKKIIMYKNYEDKLNTILSNAKGERIDLKTVELVNKSINKINNLIYKTINKRLRYLLNQ